MTFDFTWFLETAFPLFGDIFGFISYVGSMTIGDFLDFLQGIFLVDTTIEFTNIFNGSAVALTISAFYMDWSLLSISLLPLRVLLGTTLTLFAFLAKGVIYMFPFVTFSTPMWYAMIFIAFYISIALALVSWALKLFIKPS